MLLQVGDPGLKRLQILLSKLCLRNAPVIFQRPDGRHQYHRVRLKPRHPAFDIHKLLRPQVGSEAGLRDHIVGHLKGGLRGAHGIAAVGYVGEGPAVDKGRRIFQRLDQIGLHGVLKKGRHGSHRVQIRGGDWLPLEIVGHHHFSKPLL